MKDIRDLRTEFASYKKRVRNRVIWGKGILRNTERQIQWVICGNQRWNAPLPRPLVVQLVCRLAKNRTMDSLFRLKGLMRNLKELQCRMT